MSTYQKVIIYGLGTVMLVTACGSPESDPGLTGWVEENGFGPIVEPVQLGEMDTRLAVEGLDIFAAYCTDCHALEGMIIGPALRRSVDRRSPEFIMNYIRNPVENRENHPAGQELAEHYPAPMIDLNMTEEEARAIYEYLRYYNEHRENPPWD